MTAGTYHVLRFPTRQLRMTSVARPRQCQVEFALDHRMDEFPNPIAQASFDRVKPIVEKVDSCLGSRLRLKLRGNVRHGVVSSPALQRRMIRGSSPRRLRHHQFLPTQRRDLVALWIALTTTK